MPQKASKAQAALQLKQKLACDRLVVFGDGKNDIDMFQIADKSYAVANAHNDLKQYATVAVLLLFCFTLSHPPYIIHESFLPIEGLISLQSSTR